eukprot:CAMPEP_0181211336 /NCGR_PEP_ID=MMETSP1096-20121128/23727_1 /TAXON_ID=156174 ORGANISM="Chrysochromulina ericina, Strain CCMP281" /NCGR_SAMPLE_ID=MMETSP1096 /ASSEMBLY_ACC=CAM_ASM_000453 /LENGTH=89 /DNA_ID=CAMNT_0023302721 /DNA_START=572 /DNA_END=841 /DNA_ORIENTATION=+
MQPGGAWEADSIRILVAEVEASLGRQQWHADGQAVVLPEAKPHGLINVRGECSRNRKQEDALHHHAPVRVACVWVLVLVDPKEVSDKAP